MTAATGTPGRSSDPSLRPASRPGTRRENAQVTRLAVAVWPPPDVIEIIRAFERPATADVRWSTPEQWLVNVRPLGHVADDIVPRLVAVLGDELDGAPAVDCQLGPATRRLGGQWLGAPVTGLDDLAAVVFEVTTPIVEVTHPQRFQADIVLARGRVPRELAGLPIGGAWTARVLVLVADRSSPRASRFDDIARFPLDG